MVLIPQQFWDYNANSHHDLVLKSKGLELTSFQNLQFFEQLHQAFYFQELFPVSQRSFYIQPKFWCWHHLLFDSNLYPNLNLVRQDKQYSLQSFSYLRPLAIHRKDCLRKESLR